MAIRQVALLRGINVGRAKRVAMADLRTLIEDLGYTDVRTLLNSGNVVFTTPRADAKTAAGRIEKALAAKLGLSARVMVFTADELATAVRDNPLLKIADNPSRFLIGFLAESTHQLKLEPLTKQNWAPEALAFGKRVAYLWCADGILVSPLLSAVSRALENEITSRNWATVLKLHALALEKPS